MPENNRVFSSNHGAWVEADRLQQVISTQNEPGLIYVPPGTWSESIIVTQHNLTLIGAGEESIIEGIENQPPVTVLAPHVRIFNLAVKTEYEVPAISYTHGDAPQCVLRNITVLESGLDGVFRDNNYGSAINAIINCKFLNIGRHAIHAPTGSGPKNLVSENEGEGIEEDFIRWGDDTSMLLNNRCDEAPIRLTDDADENFVIEDENTETLQGRGNNVIIQSD